MTEFVFDVVTGLQDLLRERYPAGLGHSTVIRELLQNADDAHAKRCVVALFDKGLPDAANSLLHGPGLVVWNDAPLTNRDEAALRHIGAPSKARDVSSIGRFGLGQKSVFHLCEAFFYLGRDNGRDRAGVLCPWEFDGQDPEHPDWVNFETDAPRVATLLRRALAFDAENWFAIWLPLRRETHGRRGGFLKSDLVTPEAIWSELAALGTFAPLFPQLASLERLDVLRIGDNGPAHRHSIVRDGPGLGRPGASEAHPSVTTFQGTVRVDDAVALHFWGRESSHGTDALKVIVASPSWPRRFERGVGHIPEKSAAHGASTVMRSAASSAGQIELAWAAFLPVQVERLPLTRGLPEWRIYLHGYFFPDSGRTSIPGFDDKEQTDEEGRLRRRWNETLRDDLCLPQLIPSLERSLTQGSVPLAEAKEVVSALSQSRTLKPHLPDFERIGCLVLALEADGQAWRVKLPGRRLLPFPPEVPQQFRGLFCPREASLIDPGAYLGSPNAIASWGLDDLVAVDAEALADALKGEAQAGRHLTSILSCVLRGAEPTRERDATAMRWVRALVRLGGAKPLCSAHAKDTWRAALRALNDARTAPRLRFVSSVSDRIFRELASVEGSVLILPHELEPEEQPAADAVVPVAEVAPYLHKIADLADVNSDDYESLGNCAASLITAVGADALAASRELRNRRFVKVWSAAASAQGQAHPLVSPAELAESPLVFQGGGFNPKVLAKLVWRATNPGTRTPGVHDVKLVEPAQLGEALGRPQLVASSIVEALKDVALSDDHDARAELLALLLKGSTGREAEGLGDGVRWLLHGRIDTPDFPIVEFSELDLSRGCVCHLARLSDAAHVAEEVYLRRLTGQQKVSLGIDRLSSPLLLEWLRLLTDADLEDLCSRYPGDIDSLLATVADDELLWRRVPGHRLHADPAKRTTAPQGRAFVATPAFRVAESLASTVILIEPRADRALQDQERFLGCWTAGHQVQTALAQPSPQDHALAVLDAVAAAPLILDDEPLRRLVSETPWLPLVSGETARPDAVLAVPSKLREALPAALCVHLRFDGQVSAALAKHPGLPHLQVLFARDCQAANAVTNALVAASPTAKAPLLLAPDLSASLIALGLAGPEIHHPGWRLIRAINELDPSVTRAVGSELIDAAFRLDSDFLKSLAERAQGNPDDDQALEFYCYYFRLASEQPGFSFAHQVLLNQQSEWVPAAQIVKYDGPEFLPANRLHSSLAGALDSRGPGRPQADPPEPLGEADQPGTGEADKALDSYFRDWPDDMAPQIGVFLLLLGKGSTGQIRRLAHRYLGSRTVEDTVDKLQTLLHAGAAPNQYSLGENSGDYQIEVVADRVRAHNFLGEIGVFELTPSSHIGSLLVEVRSIAPGTHTQRLRLRGGVQAEVQQELLRRTVEVLAEQLLGRTFHGAEFDDFWNQLGRPSQKTIERAQREILQGLPQHLKELGVQANPRLLRAIARVSDAHESLHQSFEPNRINLRARALPEFIQAQRDLFEAAKAEGPFLLERMRQKLGSYQYDPQRIPFELFQNADDAVAQLEDIDEIGERPRFVVECRDAEVTFRHWGRPITHIGKGLAADKGEALGFGSDLINMLLLNVSNKGQTETTNTGKFGLGFKSVHLVSTRPAIRSGRLAFSIQGGVLPVDETRATAPAASSRETSITLPLDGVQPEVMLREFLQTAALLPIFSQRIRSLRLRTADMGMDLGWEPRPVAGAPLISVAAGRLGVEQREGHWLVASEAAAVRGPRLALAFWLSGGQVRPLDAAFPSVWCTTPTRERLRLGFAANGPFAVDVGRGRVPEGAANDSVWERLGDLAGHALTSLAEAWEAGDDRVSRALGVEAGQDTRFWDSLWDVALAGLRNGLGAHPCLKIHGSQRGLGGVAARHRVVPTRLAGPWAGLTRWTDVRHSVGPWLADPQVATAFAPFISGVFPGGTLVREDVAGDAKRIGLPPPESIDLCGLLEAVFLVRIEAAAAAALQSLLSQIPEEHAHEIDSLGSFLAAVQMQAADRSWQPVSRLLALNDPDEADQAARAAFAPAQHVLHGDYADARALAFFRRTRRESPLRLGLSKELAAWARRAADRPPRAAALRYLLSGQFNTALRDDLREEPLPWLREPRQLNDWAEEFDALQLGDLKNALFPLPMTELPMPVDLAQGQPREALSASDLVAIGRWWDNADVRATVLRDWHQSWYPSEWSRDRLAASLNDAGAADHDAAWMMVLTLGACQQLGRSRPWQHRAFLSLLIERGWWGALCEPGPPPEGWVQLVDGWVEQGVDTKEYDWWRGILIAAYQARKHLDAYRRAFRAADHLLKASGPESLVLQQANPQLAGTDLEAPPFAALLKLGVSWILRELSRLGVISGPSVAAHCFPPRRALRLLLGFDDSAESRDLWRHIHGALGPRATLHGAFDIPLLYLARCPEVLDALRAGSAAAPVAHGFEFLSDEDDDQ